MERVQVLENDRETGRLIQEFYSLDEAIEYVTTIHDYLIDPSVLEIESIVVG